jgi:hypothetical protein
VDLLVGAASLDEEHQLAFVVRGAAAGNDLAAAADVLQRGGEGVALPKVERIDGLDVVMAVEKHMRRIRRRSVMMGDDHRVAGRGAHAGVEADRSQVRDQPFGGAAAFSGVGRVGGDRLDAEQAEQAFNALVEVLVEAVKDGG